jgi:solute carrier family 6 amino acid transporter-like protein 5/7/9/14
VAPISHTTTTNGHNNGSSYFPNKSSAMAVEDEEEERGHWGSKAEFILSCIGFSVGIGNVWRFPYLAYKNGGGTFLIPYFILLVLVGKPMYYMETAIGQFSRLSPVQVWRCAPIAKGVGIAMVVVSLIVSIYYNVIMSYSLIYVGATFQGVADNQSRLPWTYCGEWWGAESEFCADNVTTILGLEKCYSLNEEGRAERLELEFCTEEILKNKFYDGQMEEICNCTYKQVAAEQFWTKYILKLVTKEQNSERYNETYEYGMPKPGDLGGFDYPIPLALMASWIVVFLCLMKGVKSSGKVVYFTATFPYVILLALLVRGVTLPGATDGLWFLIKPDWYKLLDWGVWQDAASQLFFSLGVSWGGLMMFGSYNKFHNKINIDAAFVSSLDFVTSMISSTVIFSVLGFLAKELGDVPIDTVVDAGPGLAFIAYPQALAKMPLPHLWSALFFIMLFFLGLDSEFALLETALTAIYDGYPRLRRHKVKITAISCVCCYLLGLPCCSYAGQYILDLMDTYGAGFAVLWIAFWECVGFMWIYKFTNFSKDIKLMLGKEPSWFWKIMWAFVCPAFLLVIFCFSIQGKIENPPTYGGVPYPDWFYACGWALCGLSAFQIPLWAIFMTLYYASKGKVKDVIKPTSSWGPGDKEVRNRLLEEMGGITQVPRYAYDNNGMAYEAYNM